MTEIHANTLVKEHTHPHPHDHKPQPTNLLYRLATALHLPGFGHDHHSRRQDTAIYENNLAIRTVILALFGLGLTTILQIIIFMMSGSIALLADTVHNFGDAVNSLPLLFAFMIARRLPTQRYTYGFGRGEDIAGILIVLSIAFSAGYILFESVNKLIHPTPIENLTWIALAALIGFVGNEFVASLQIRVGRKIGSDAMVADGLHARTDGLTSLAVLIAVGGAWFGLPILDPIIGIIIGLAIVGITWGASKSIWYRLMDAVNPELVQTAKTIINEHIEILEIERLQLRWVGHRLHGEARIRLQPRYTLDDINQLVSHLQQHFEHDLPNLSEFTIQVG